MYRITQCLSVGPFASADRVPELLAAGVTHVLNVSDVPSVLTSSDQGFQEVVWEPLDDFTRMPFHTLTYLLDTLHRMVSEAGAHVYVHCVAGHLRSPTTLWLYLIACGLSPEGARDLIGTHSHEANPGHRRMINRDHVRLAQEHGSEHFLPLARPELIVPFPLAEAE